MGQLGRYMGKSVHIYAILWWKVSLLASLCDQKVVVKKCPLMRPLMPFIRKYGAFLPVFDHFSYQNDDFSVGKVVISWVVVSESGTY